MPRRKQPDNIPIADMLDSPSEILSRALNARQDDPWHSYDRSRSFAGARQNTSYASENDSDDDGQMWWS